MLFTRSLCAGIISTVFLLTGCAAPQAVAPISSAPTLAPTTRQITDMRDKAITIPVDPQRVAVFDKGFLIQTMVAMGITDRIVASGGLVQPTSIAEERDTLTLCPALLTLPQLGYPTDAVDYEALAAAKPDLVLLRNSEYIKDSEITAQMITRIEQDLKLPLVVVNSPGVYDEVRYETQLEGIQLMGEVFAKESRAAEIVQLLQAPLTLIEERTRDIPEAERPTVLYLGLSGQDAVGTVWGENFGDAKFSGAVASIKNAYATHGREKMSAEQILSLAPEVIILCTNSVRPHPDILTTDPSYQSLRTLPALQNNRISSLGLLTWWGDFRLELPTILLISAKSAYPDRFADISVGDWLNKYHQSLYGLSDADAQSLKSVQQLTWMDEKNF